MANPHNSIWNKHKPTYNRLHKNFTRIKNHLTTSNYEYYEQSLLTIITPSCKFYISKSNDKFRPKSHLDWAYYTPKTLAAAINNDDVELYYEKQLKDVNSDPNIWKRLNEEQDLKSYYACRAGRASII